MDIAALIEDNDECVFLDFKREEYHDSNKPEMIKDVLAFANAGYTHERYIIIGIKKDHEGLTVNPVEQPQDSAAIQQYIHENITPELSVSYISYSYQGQNIMVLVISDTNEQPYYPKKQLNRGNGPFLRPNEFWIRKGSRNVAGIREDLEKVYARRYAQTTLEGKIDLTFKNGRQSIELPILETLELPSEQHKAEIIKNLNHRQHIYENHGRIYIEKYGHYSPDEDGDSYEAMDINTLKERLANVERNYHDENHYHIFEEHGVKLQLTIANNGKEHLKDAMIEMVFPVTTGFYITDRVPLTTYQLSVATGIDYQAGYPKVKVQYEQIRVSHQIGEIRHKVPTEVFTKPLRLAALEVMRGADLKVQATIYAANLPNPQSFELTISFK
ncbi:ATP-binding protein [Mucilaginibacter roseus]|uniref:ATP-binding protein n=1 Tax=Mucilaginibacter roseus TaxID=1528868 RepID=A0ABS8TZ73_9SPHI|nr:ATP-binding protein [Mucilaginibacter roseus]MCD8739687.1 ATP-binding protein [Mucilaginibacter roseus]